MPRSRTILTLLTLAITLPANACLWDRDTLGQEAVGNLEVIATSIGWFDRFPPLYYEMRLKRVEGDLKKSPEVLDLYDDAAVACDRLGRQDEAIEWMRKKQLQMEALHQPNAADHQYRHLANLGTFHAHRWIKTPERNVQLADLEKAIGLIDEAIKLNPNAHFGREVAQLALLKWLHRYMRHPQAKSASSIADIPDSIFEVHQTQPSLDLSAALCGLVQMGAAWESIDVFVWLAYSEGMVKPDGHRRSPNTSLAAIACGRIAELAAAGKLPICGNEDLIAVITPDSLIKTDAELRNLNIQIAQRLCFWGPTQGWQEPAVFYAQARRKSEERFRAKTQFMLDRLHAGQHPDTDPNFWDGWVEPEMPEVPRTPLEKIFGLSLSAQISKFRDQLLLGSILVGALLLCLFIRVRIAKRERTRTQIRD